jgi:hypothetical protein
MEQILYSLQIAHIFLKDVTIISKQIVLWSSLVWDEKGTVM